MKVWLADLVGIMDRTPTIEAVQNAVAKHYLRDLMEETQGDVSAAARIAGRDRTHLYKLLEKHQIDPKLYRREKPKANEPEVKQYFGVDVSP